MQLVLEGNIILDQICEPWNNQESAEHLAQSMLEIMQAENGIGLSAPQVGKNYRVFVMSYQGETYACFNPKILSSSSVMVSAREGCLSFPGLWLNIKRPAEIEVEFQTVDGTVKQMKFDGILARCFQHELDHLNGICFVEHAAKLSLRLARDRQRKLLTK